MDDRSQAPVEPRVSVGASTQTAPSEPSEDSSLKVTARGVSVRYGSKQALSDVSIEIPDRKVTALIGPSGCGKTTFLRCINRMNDIIEGAKVTGVVEIEGKNIYDRIVDTASLRRRVGMVFQKPNPFPASIYANVAYGPRIHRMAKSKSAMNDIVEGALRRAGLWEEVKDRLAKSGADLSGGQQQRLVIARTIAVQPDIILMDEPCSALDPLATAKIEELIDELREDFCIVIVTHSMAQAARVSQKAAFFHLGQLVEVRPTDEMFTNPHDERTQDYITGRFG